MIKKFNINKYKNLEDKGYVKLISLGLSEDEASAIKRYSADSERITELNRRLRERIADEEDLEIEGLLNSGLAKLPKYKGIVYRGIKIKNPKEFLKEYTPENEIDFNQFVSSTKKIDLVFEGNIVYVIKSKGGIDIEDFSVKPQEQEVLFKSNSKFLVQIVSEENIKEIYKHIIQLEEL